MDIKTLKRDPAKVHACLQELEDGRLVAKKTLKIYIPCRFAERGLASISIETRIIGIYGIVTEDGYYGVSTVNAMMLIEPTSTMKVVIGGNDYYEFKFDPGSTVIESVDLVKSDILVYRIYDEIIAKGHVPWYLGYLELGRIFDTANYHAGANIGNNHEVTELIISMIARNSADRHKYYRQTVESIDELRSDPPVYIPLRSVIYSATNTTNKLAGSYMDLGLVSALVSPSTRTEHIESILRA